VNVPANSEWELDVDTDSGSQDINVRKRTGATPMSLHADSGSVHVDYR